MLALTGIEKKYRGFALSVTGLEVAEGSHHMLLGPTGSGKTLLINIIAGLVSPDRGMVTMKGRDITSLAPEDRAFGIVYQDSALFSHLDVVGNIGFGLSIRGMRGRKVRRAVGEIMDELGISSLYGRSIAGLSGGEKQRVAIARALIIKPGLILLDEPFSSLDYMTKIEMIEFIKKIRREYAPTLFHITHDFEEAMALADDVSVIREGSILQSGRVHEVFHSPADVFTAGFIGARNIFPGRISGSGDGTVFRTDSGVDITIGRDVSGSCRNVMIRADDVIIAREPIESSAVNRLRGTIVDILPKRGINEVCVDVGFSLFAYITNRSMMELSLTTGEAVYVVFKGTAVHVF
ncbi:MAG TPA: ABC transporter ATP-binding protein [Spirochaetota bacterium]|nr:ABC transporter ATP-binding protein [Spirochaetota bacterium]HPI87834.1 ABC transporter ATP-binding protein [Spirochaetota bacterium]HPR47434.1 ABC transporter ATP-binding protein [Spirochaetota bacterium]